MTRLILIRHGETDWNVEGRYQGQADPPLNSRGFQQAELLAELLASRPAESAQDSGMQLIYTSPLKRALQTARIISQQLNITLHVEPRFMEIHQGDWQTRLRAEIESLYPDLFKRWETKPWEVTPPQGEHLQEVQKRVFAAVDEILHLHPNEVIGIVSHRIPIALIKMRFQGLEPDVVRTLQLPNTYFEEIKIPVQASGKTVEAPGADQPGENERLSK